MSWLVFRSRFSYLLERSPPVFTQYGCRFAALGGTAPRRVSVAEYVPYWETPRSTSACNCSCAGPDASAPTRANTACDPGGEPPAAALAERVGDFNMSMDPWERTGAAPQRWTTHLAPDGTTCSRMYSATTPRHYSPLLWSPAATAGTENGPADTEAATLGCVGKASSSVSVLSRALLCPNTCRHCRCKPCDIATDHDDHICTIVSKGNCFLNEFPSGKPRACPSVTLGVRSAPLNDAARGVLTNTTYACSANDEEWFSSPCWGRGSLGCQRRLTGIDLVVRTFGKNY